MGTQKEDYCNSEATLGSLVHSKAVWALERGLFQKSFDFLRGNSSEEYNPQAWLSRFKAILPKFQQKYKTEAILTEPNSLMG